MWLMLQTETPDDFILATNETRSVREFVEIDPRYYRPTEVELLLGNPQKAKDQLGWEPKITFQELVELMVRSDWEKVKVRGY